MLHHAGAADVDGGGVAGAAAEAELADHEHVVALAHGVEFVEADVVAVGHPRALHRQQHHAQAGADLVAAGEVALERAAVGAAAEGQLADLLVLDLDEGGDGPQAAEIAAHHAGEGLDAGGDRLDLVGAARQVLELDLALLVGLLADGAALAAEVLHRDDGVGERLVFVVEHGHQQAGPLQQADRDLGLGQERVELEGAGGEGGVVLVLQAQAPMPRAEAVEAEAAVFAAERLGVSALGGDRREHVVEQGAGLRQGPEAGAGDRLGVARVEHDAGEDQAGAERELEGVAVALVGRHLGAGHGAALAVGLHRDLAGGQALDPQPAVGAGRLGGLLPGHQGRQQVAVEGSRQVADAGALQRLAVLLADHPQLEAAARPQGEAADVERLAGHHHGGLGGPGGEVAVGPRQDQESALRHRPEQEAPVLADGALAALGGQVDPAFGRDHLADVAGHLGQDEGLGAGQRRAVGEGHAAAQVGAGVELDDHHLVLARIEGDARSLPGGALGVHPEGVGAGRQAAEAQAAVTAGESLRSVARPQQAGEVTAQLGAGGRAGPGGLDGEFGRRTAVDAAHLDLDRDARQQRLQSDLLGDLALLLADPAGLGPAPACVEGDLQAGAGARQGQAPLAALVGPGALALAHQEQGLAGQLAGREQRLDQQVLAEAAAAGGVSVGVGRGAGLLRQRVLRGLGLGGAGGGLPGRGLGSVREEEDRGGDRHQDEQEDQDDGCAHDQLAMLRRCRFGSPGFCSSPAQGRNR